MTKQEYVDLLAADFLDPSKDVTYVMLFGRNVTVKRQRNGFMVKYFIPVRQRHGTTYREKTWNWRDLSSVGFYLAELEQKWAKRSEQEQV